MPSHPSCDHLGQTLFKLYFSNTLRIIEMVPVLKKLKVWTLYVHIVAQVNHRSLGVTVETNCLRDSNLIPRHSFLSTLVGPFQSSLMGFESLCVFACSRMADKANLSSEWSKCKQSKAILKVMTQVMPWLRYISFKTKTYCHFFLLCKLRSYNSQNLLFNNSTCVYRNTCKLCKV